MADKKSREVVVLGVESNHRGTDWGLIALTEDGKRYAVTEEEYSRLEAGLIRKQLPALDFTQVLYEAYSDGSPIIDKDETSGRSIEIEVNIDVSEALTGLKAVQREAKEATKALRELETESKKSTTVYDLQTQAIREELASRRGDRGALEALALIDELREQVSELTQGRNLTEVPTKDLHEELAKREGVEEIVVEAYGSRAYLRVENGLYGTKEVIEGPARILINKD